MEDLERIKGKIAKLMNLAEKATNEHEAASAMSKARALMDKYDLEQADIIEVDGVSVEFLSASATRAFKACPKFMQHLAVAVARFNDCQAQFEGGHPINFKANAKRVHNYGNVIVFRGYKRDVEIAIDMYARLLGAVNRLCREWLDDNGHEGKYPVGLGGKFKEGAVSTITSVLQAAQIERQKLTTASGTGLVVVKGAAVDKYFGEAKYGTSKSKPMNDEQAEAYREGRMRGQQIEVQKKVTA